MDSAGFTGKLKAVRLGLKLELLRSENSVEVNSVGAVVVPYPDRCFNGCEIVSNGNGEAAVV